MAVQQGGNKQAGASNSATQYLRDFIQETDPTGTPPDVALKNKHARASAAKKLAQIEQERQSNAQDAAARAEARADRAAQSAQRAADKNARKAEDVADSIGRAASQVGDTIAGSVSSGRDWLASLPTPGSIALLLAVLLFFIFAVVPVGANGETRLQLLWLTVTGKTRIIGEQPMDMGKFTPSGQITGSPGSTTIAASFQTPSMQTMQQPLSTGAQPSQSIASSAVYASNGAVVNPNTGYTPDFGLY